MSDTGIILGPTRLDLWERIDALRAENAALREQRQCGKCGRDVTGGDCYGCECDRLLQLI